MKPRLLQLLIPAFSVTAIGLASAQERPRASPSAASLPAPAAAGRQGGPASQPVRQSKGATPPSTRPAIEYRFDALRVDGTLHGPEALEVRSSLGGEYRPLHRLERSFSHRTVGSIESPSLHR